MQPFISKGFKGIVTNTLLLVTGYLRSYLSENGIFVCFLCGKGFSGIQIKKERLVNLSLTVARPGFEPRHTEPKSVVLPLYYRAIRPIHF